MLYSYTIEFGHSILSTLQKSLRLLKKELDDMKLDKTSFEYIYYNHKIEEFETKIEMALHRTHSSEITEINKYLGIL